MVHMFVQKYVRSIRSVGHSQSAINLTISVIFLKKLLFFLIPRVHSVGQKRRDFSQHHTTKYPNKRQYTLMRKENFTFKRIKYTQHCLCMY